MITRDDVIVALSWSGETGELRDLIEYAKRFRVALIAFTANAKSTLAEAADVLLLLPQATEACPLGLAPTTSTLIQLALGDALAVALFESHGFTALQFRELHPGGKLGALLKFVRDIMHRGDRLPIAPLGTTMSEAVLEISTKGFGCVGIVDLNGRLAGIITDGDLRRHWGPELLRQRVDDIMTKGAVTIRPEQLASEALEVMNSAKGGKGITALFVVDAGKPVGLVHMHDLLRIGVA
jgi:arabinose-5-phosphate isomerase